MFPHETQAAFAARCQVLIGLSIFVVALVMLGVFTSGLTQQYIIGGSGARQPLGGEGRDLVSDPKTWGVQWGSPRKSKKSTL
jgi:hypothetical protein